MPVSTPVRPPYMSSTRKRPHTIEECGDSDSDIEVVAEVKRAKHGNQGFFRVLWTDTVLNLCNLMKRAVPWLKFYKSAATGIQHNTEMDSEFETCDDSDENSESVRSSKPKQQLGHHKITSRPKNLVTLSRTRNIYLRRPANEKPINKTIIDITHSGSHGKSVPVVQKGRSFSVLDQQKVQQDQHHSSLSLRHNVSLTSNGFSGRAPTNNFRFPNHSSADHEVQVIDSRNVSRPSTPFLPKNSVSVRGPHINGSLYGRARSDNDDTRLYGINSAMHSTRYGPESSREHRTNGLLPGNSMCPVNGSSRTRRVPMFNRGIHKSNFTTNEAIRMHEKEQYRMLIAHFSVNSRYCVATTIPENRNSETQVKAAVDDGPAFSLETIDLPPHSLLLDKYQKPCQLVRKGELTATKMSDQSSKWRSPAVKSVATETVSVDDDEPIILPWKRTTPKNLPLPTGHSPHYGPEWVKQLKETVEEERIERLKYEEQHEREAAELRAKRAAKFEAERLRLEKLKLSGPVLAEGDREADFPELTQEMEAIIDNALLQTVPDEVLSKVNEYQVLRKDVDTLAGCNWLNDEVINFYMALIVERSKLDNYPSVYAFSSFFYPSLKTKGYSAVRRWTRKVDIFSYDINLVPLHFGVHWCLAVIDFRYKKIQFYDSMGGKDSCLETLRDYLMQECLDKKKRDYDLSGWTLEKMMDIPPQLNGSDCGMFALKYAEYITRNARITFTQENMQYFRRRTVYEIMARQLM